MDGYPTYEAAKYTADGYGSITIQTDGYIQFTIGGNHTKQLNIRITEEDITDIEAINSEFFEGEATNSMLGRILLRKGIAFYKRLSSNVGSLDPKSSNG